jgi:hypothetical protein
MPGLRALLEFCLETLEVDLVVIEITTSRMANGGALMEHAGIVRGMLAMLPVRVERVTPASWKKTAKAPADKKESTVRAEQIFPDHRNRFRGPQGGHLDGLAEAAMMALHGHIAVLQQKDKAA